MQDLTLATMDVRAVPSNRRFIIMGMLFVTVVINYLDRANLSIAAPGITTEFHLTPVQLGLVFVVKEPGNREFGGRERGDPAQDFFVGAAVLKIRHQVLHGHAARG